MFNFGIIELYTCEERGKVIVFSAYIDGVEMSEAVEEETELDFVDMLMDDHDFDVVRFRYSGSRRV